MARRISKQVAAFFDAEIESWRRKGDAYLNQEWPNGSRRNPQPASARQCFEEAEKLVQLKHRLLAVLASPATSQERAPMAPTADHDTHVTDEGSDPATEKAANAIKEATSAPSAQGDGDSGDEHDATTPSTADENEG